MNVTKSIMQVKQNRRIRISKNAIFTNGIFFLIIKLQNKGEGYYEEIIKCENDYT